MTEKEKLLGNVNNAEVEKIVAVESLIAKTGSAFVFLVSFGILIGSFAYGEINNINQKSKITSCSTDGLDYSLENCFSLNNGTGIIRCFFNDVTITEDLEIEDIDTINPIVLLVLLIVYYLFIAYLVQQVRKLQSLAYDFLKHNIFIKIKIMDFWKLLVTILLLFVAYVVLKALFISETYSTFFCEQIIYVKYDKHSQLNWSNIIVYLLSFAGVCKYGYSNLSDIYGQITITFIIDNPEKKILLDSFGKIVVVEVSKFEKIITDYFASTYPTLNKEDLRNRTNIRANIGLSKWEEKDYIEIRKLVHYQSSVN